MLGGLANYIVLLQIPVMYVCQNNYENCLTTWQSYFSIANNKKMKFFGLECIHNVIDWRRRNYHLIRRVSVEMILSKDRPS